MKPKVYFSRVLTPENAVRIYRAVGRELPGRVAVKVHSGEQGNQNYLKPEFLRPVIEDAGGTVVECNTAYGGERNTTEKHRKLMHSHGWAELFNVDIMDSSGPDMCLDIPKGRVLKRNLVGRNLAHYDSMLVLSHFKGHPMGGYGGALKQLSIGCASSAGKALIHSAGYTDDQNTLWEHIAPQDMFIEAMADAAYSVTEYFKGRIAYVNIMCNLSVDCDCCAVAEDPCMKDIGMLSSSDPVALDKACLDMIYAATEDPGQKHFIQRVESRHGAHIIEAAELLGCGSSEYELVDLDG